MKQFKVTVNGNTYDVQVEEVAASGGGSAPAATAAAPAAAAASAKAAAQTGSVGAVRIDAPMPGAILEVKTAVGAAVARGDVLLILEAMKMENEIVAPQDGTVAGIHVAKGDMVETGALLVSLD